MPVRQIYIKITKIIHNISFLKNRLINIKPSQTPHNLEYKISPNIINTKHNQL